MRDANSFYFAGDMEAFKEANGLRTGQEFYDRFEGEFGPHPASLGNDMQAYIQVKEVYEVAKKAAGLKESETE